MHWKNGMWSIIDLAEAWQGLEGSEGPSVSHIP